MVELELPIILIVSIPSIIYVILAIRLFFRRKHLQNSYPLLSSLLGLIIPIGVFVTIFFFFLDSFCKTNYNIVNDLIIVPSISYISIIIYLWHNICLSCTFTLKKGFSIKKQVSPCRNFFRKFLNQETRRFLHRQTF